MTVEYVSPQPVAMRLALDAIVAMYLHSTQGRKTNRDTIEALLKVLGTVKWRRIITPNGISQLYQKVGSVVPSEDDDRTEWLMPAFGRFFANIQEHSDLKDIIDTVMKGIVASGLGDLPEYGHLNVPSNELNERLSTNPMVVFLYCLYHSDIRRFIGST